MTLRRLLLGDSTEARHRPAAEEQGSPAYRA
jgi:hypothetical protein